MGKRRTITADQAARVAGCSATTIRKKLVPVEVERIHVYGMGERVAYRYSTTDAEHLRDKKPIRRRKHPDEETREVLRSRAKKAAEMSSLGREVAAEAGELEITIPDNTPSCCRRHAINHVRHEGTDYDGVLAYRQSQKGFSRADAGHSELQMQINKRIIRRLVNEQRLPEIEDCSATSNAQRVSIEDRDDG